MLCDGDAVKSACLVEMYCDGQLVFLCVALCVAPPPRMRFMHTRTHNTCASGPRSPDHRTSVVPVA